MRRGHTDDCMDRGIVGLACNCGRGDALACVPKTEADASDPKGKVRTFCTVHGRLWPCESGQRHGEDES